MGFQESLLTVIIFAYNHEETIAKAIDGVLQQTTDYPYEIWLCEDCSTDTTLDICTEYAKQYPDKIKVFSQPVNTFKFLDERNHVYQAFSRIDKKYFCYLDGDDYWCDKDKIQVALDVLENNPAYTTFAHDTLVKNHCDGTETSLAKSVDLQKHQLGNKVTLENLLHFGLFFHPSARIHRNIINLSKTPVELLVDIFILYVFLDKGPLYYHDKVMSVYNITGLGSWSKLSGRTQRKIVADVFYKINLLLDYKFDVYFTRMVMKKKVLKLLKIFFGKHLGWRLWYYCVFRSRPSALPAGCCRFLSDPTGY